jgi:hypothetical protein
MSQAPQPKPLFPTLGSTQEVVDLAKSQLPIMDNNTLLTVLGTYHNTLLNEVKVPIKPK